VSLTGEELVAPIVVRLES